MHGAPNRQTGFCPFEFKWTQLIFAKTKAIALALGWVKWAESAILHHRMNGNNYNYVPIIPSRLDRWLADFRGIWYFSFVYDVQSTSFAPNTNCSRDQQIGCRNNWFRTYAAATRMLYWTDCERRWEKRHSKWMNVCAKANVLNRFGCTFSEFHVAIDIFGAVAVATVSIAHWKCK